ncbi:MAG TPA: hypothetical protein VK936_16065 [Longimicrobiales bacterium]|nr:hypothetical protein [Longimicrobiales bacterium]
MRNTSSRPPRRRRSAPATRGAASGSAKAPPLQAAHAALPADEPPRPRTHVGLGHYETAYDVRHGYGTERHIVIPRAQV